MSNLAIEKIVNRAARKRATDVMSYKWKSECIQHHVNRKACGYALRTRQNRLWAYYPSRSQAPRQVASPIFNPYFLIIELSVACTIACLWLEEGISERDLTDRDILTHGLTVDRNISAGLSLNVTYIDDDIQVPKNHSAISSGMPLESKSLTEQNASTSTLGQRLREIRAKIVASGEPLLDWEGLEREKAVRRRYRDIHEK